MVICKCGKEKGTNPNCSYCKSYTESRTLGEWGLELAQKEFDEQSIDETLISDEDIIRALEFDTLEQEGMRKELTVISQEDLKGVV